MADTTYNNRKRYLKDKKIDILRKDEGSGHEPGGGGWKPKHKNIWAYYRQASAKEYDRAGLAGHEIEAVFRINWKDDISINDRVHFRGEDYDITRIDDFEGYKKDLTLYANNIKP